MPLDRDAKLAHAHHLVATANDERGNIHERTSAAFAACKLIAGEKLLPPLPTPPRPGPPRPTAPPWPTTTPPPPAPGPATEPGGDPGWVRDFDASVSKHQGRHMKASKDGTCRWCKGQYLKGDEIYWEMSYGFLHDYCQRERSFEGELFR